MADTAFALTGVDCNAVLAGRAVPPWWCMRAKAGDVLTISAPKRGARAYLTFEGGIDLPRVLGSRSTHIRAGFGGLEGRALQEGDVVPVGQTPRQAAGRFDFGAVPPDMAIAGLDATEDGVLRVRVMRAGEYDLFSGDVQAKFWSTIWKISRNSDRGGYRLDRNRD